VGVQADRRGGEDPARVAGADRVEEAPGECGVGAEVALARQRVGRVDDLRRRGPAREEVVDADRAAVALEGPAGAEDAGLPAPFGVNAVMVNDAVTPPVYSMFTTWWSTTSLSQP